MSEVADGPETNVSGAVGESAPIASGTVATICSAWMTQTWWSGIKVIARRPHAAPPSRTIVPVSATASAAPDVYRRHEDVRGAVVGELDDQLGEIGLDRRDPFPRERVVEADLVGGDRLDLDRLARARRPHQARDDRVGLRTVARPVDHATNRHHRGLELLEVHVEVTERPLLDPLAGLPELLPVLDLGRPEDLREMDDAHPGTLARQAAADLQQACVIERRAHLGAGVEHVAHLVREHRARGIGVLDREGAPEATARARLGQLDQPDPPHLAQQPQRRIPDLQQPQRMAARVIGDLVREVSADILTPSTPTRNCDSSHTRGASAAT